MLKSIHISKLIHVSKRGPRCFIWFMPHWPHWHWDSHTNLWLLIHVKEATVKNTGKWVDIWPQQNATKRKSCVHYGHVARRSFWDHHSVECVFKIKSVLAAIFHAIYGLCVFSLPIYRMMIVRIRVLYLLTIIKSEVWPICRCLGLGDETM